MTGFLSAPERHLAEGQPVYVLRVPDGETAEGKHAWDNFRKRVLRYNKRVGTDDPSGEATWRKLHRPGGTMVITTVPLSGQAAVPPFVSDFEPVTDGDELRAQVENWLDFDSLDFTGIKPGSSKVHSTASAPSWRTAPSRSTTIWIGDVPRARHDEVVAEFDRLAAERFVHPPRLNDPQSGEADQEAVKQLLRRALTNIQDAINRDKAEQDPFFFDGDDDTVTFYPARASVSADDD